MAAGLNGAVDRVNWGPTITGVTALAAVSMWIKTTQATANVELLGHWSATSREGWGLLLNTAANKIQASCWDASIERISLVSTTSVNDGNWHLIVFNMNAANGGANALYIDGASEATANSSAAWAGNSANSLVAGKAINSFWATPVVSMAEVAYWNGVNLDAAEIAALFKGYSPRLIRPGALEMYASLVRSYSDIRDAAHGQGAGATSVVDHPRIIGGTAAGNNVNTVTLNPSDKAANITLSNNNMKATKTTADALNSVRATRGIASTDSGYFEVVIDVAGVTGTFMLMGIGNSTAPLTSYPGSDTNGWGYYQDDGHKYTNGADAGAMGTTYKADGDIVMAAFKNGSLWFGKNGTWNGDPSAGTGAAFTGITGTLFPMLAPYRATATAQSVTARFHAWAFSYAIPTGINAWDVG